MSVNQPITADQCMTSCCRRTAFYNLAFIPGKNLTDVYSHDKVQMTSSLILSFWLHQFLRKSKWTFVGNIVTNDNTPDKKGTSRTPCFSSKRQAERQ